MQQLIRMKGKATVYYHIWFYFSLKSKTISRVWPAQNLLDVSGGCLTQDCWL